MYTDIYTVSRNKLFVFAGLITTKKGIKQMLTSGLILSNFSFSYKNEFPVSQRSLPQVRLHRKYVTCA